MTDPGYVSPSEWRELILIMKDAQYVRPPPAQERRLRELLALRNVKASTMTWDDLLSFALVVVGGHFLAKAWA